jgi:hypothetical protein
VLFFVVNDRWRDLLNEEMLFGKFSIYSYNEALASTNGGILLPTYKIEIVGMYVRL